MGIISAAIAFLEALDGDRTRPGPAAAAAQPVTFTAPAEPREPLGKVVEALAARVASLESQIDGIKSYTQLEVDRGIRASQSAQRAVSRLRDELQGSSELDDPDGDVPVVDARAGGASGVPAVSAGVERAPTPEEIRQAARRAVAFQ